MFNDLDWGACRGGGSGCLHLSHGYVVQIVCMSLGWRLSSLACGAELLFTGSIYQPRTAKAPSAPLHNFPILRNPWTSPCIW